MKALDKAVEWTGFVTNGIALVACWLLVVVFLLFFIATPPVAAIVAFWNGFYWCSMGFALIFICALHVVLSGVRDEINRIKKEKEMFG